MRAQGLGCHSAQNLTAWRVGREGAEAVDPPSIRSRRGVRPPLTEHAHSLFRDALSLSAEERADLLAELLVSLEDAPVDEMATVEHAWTDELETRARRVLSGQVDAEEWTQVRTRVSQALTDG